MWLSLNDSSIYELALPHGAVASFTGVILVCQLTASVLINGFVLYAITSINAKLRRLSVNWMVFNIIAAELGFAVSFGLGNFYYFFIDRNEMVCAITGVAELLILMCGCILYAQLALNRYMAFFHEYAFERWCTVRNTIALQLLTWLLLAGIVAPLLPYAKYEALHFCFIDMANTKFALPYTASCVCVVLSFYGAVMVYCNLKVSRKLAAHRAALKQRNFASQAVQVETFANVLRILYFHAFCTPLFMMPMTVIRFVPGIETMPWLARVSGLLLGFEPCLSPLVFTFWLKPLREAVAELLPSACRRSRAVVQAAASDVVTDALPTASHPSTSVCAKPSLEA